MRYLVSVIIVLALSLWLGGLITLFISVNTLFSTDHTIAVQAAPIIFRFFGTYQLVLAAVAIVGAFLLYVFSGSRWAVWLFILFGLAAIGAVILATLIMPQMQQIRRSGNSASPEFRLLHAKSMMVYVAETASLLVAGMILPAALNPSRRRTTIKADPATNAPA